MEPAPHTAVRFSHNAERQLARLLDFFGVAWEYEPRTFVLATGDDGAPRLAFTPDFHLPEYDRWLEVTTLDQRHVTRKNRKLRLLREQVPGIDARLVYQRDYLDLAVKYGLEPPEQLAGLRLRTPGVEVPPSGAAGPPAAPGVAGPARPPLAS